jgi:hypothetical protein
MNAPNCPDPIRRRLALCGSFVLSTGLLAGCAGPSLGNHAGEQPMFDFRRYFDGTVLAHGLVSDRAGKVLRRFVVTMRCSWSGDDGTLDEEFVYSDGERQRRVWRVRRGADGHYTGTADDVVGQASGAASGPAFNWRYTLRLPVRGRVYDIDFDDWMYQVDARTVLNRAVMSKFGVRVGDIVLSFSKT